MTSKKTETTSLSTLSAPTRRSLLLGTGALGLAAAFPMPSIAQSRTKVIVSEAIHIALYTPLYTAMRKDLFAKQGLDVELSTAGGIAVPVSVLLANRAQFALTGTGMSVNSTLEGGKMKVIAKVAGGVSLFAIAKPGLKINSLADLKGKTIATLRFPSNTISTPTYLMRSIGGFDPKEAGVNFLELPPGAQAAAVKDGRADLAIAFDWDASIGVTQFGLEVVYSFADILGPIAFSSVFVTEPYLKSNGETVQKFTNALADAMKLLHTDPNTFEEVSRLEFPSVAPEVVKLGAKNFMTTKNVVPRNPIVTKEDWDAIMKHESGAGTLKKTLPYEEMVDTAIATKAAADFGLKS
ncbi:MAG: ABC transporter substrate-binding protein [Rhodopseudomonas palustris]|uniref:ABC transporter substrate-binding protein n=1 Tax=Rhodopseudomonas palustris TaxID=1076 RepID=A0A933S091_RHOPL|nr:ABC transporter substrate-binding protein [Rhodopseudomonas palustris]